MIGVSSWLQIFPVFPDYLFCVLGKSAVESTDCNQASHEMAFAPQIVIKRSGNTGFSSRIDQLWGVHLSGAVDRGDWDGFSPEDPRNVAASGANCQPTLGRWMCGRGCLGVIASVAVPRCGRLPHACGRVEPACHPRQYHRVRQDRTEAELLDSGVFGSVFRKSSCAVDPETVEINPTARWSAR
jgi:hypothetical protein